MHKIDSTPAKTSGFIVPLPSVEDIRKWRPRTAAIMTIVHVFVNRRSRPWLPCGRPAGGAGAASAGTAGTAEDLAAAARRTCRLRHHLHQRHRARPTKSWSEYAGAIGEGLTGVVSDSCDGSEAARQTEGASRSSTEASGIVAIVVSLAGGLLTLRSVLPSAPAEGATRYPPSKSLTVGRNDDGTLKVHRPYLVLKGRGAPAV
jgi:hypothetical protein